MAHHDDSTSQQDDQSSSTEWAPGGEQAPEQEEGRREAQAESEQGLVAASEAAYEQSNMQEDGVPQQSEIGTPPQGATEPVDPTMDHQDDETPSTSPEEPPEREAVPVLSERLEAPGD